MNVGLWPDDPLDNIQLSGLKAKNYDNHLNLVNTKVTCWYPQAFNNVIVEIHDSDLADLQWNIGEVTFIIYNSTCVTALSMQEVEYQFYDSYIHGDVTAKDDSKIYLYNTEVNGEYYEVDNG